MGNPCNNPDEHPCNYADKCFMIRASTRIFLFCKKTQLFCACVKPFKSIWHSEVQVILIKSNCICLFVWGRKSWNYIWCPEISTYKTRVISIRSIHPTSAKIHQPIRVGFKITCAASLTCRAWRETKNVELAQPCKKLALVDKGALKEEFSPCANVCSV